MILKHVQRAEISPGVMRAHTGDAGTKGRERERERRWPFLSFGVLALIVIVDDGIPAPCARKISRQRERASRKLYVMISLISIVVLLGILCVRAYLSIYIFIKVFSLSAALHSIDRFYN